LKNKDLVLTKFSHGKLSYEARVFRYSPTAIILLDRTVLLTNCIVHTKGQRRDPDGLTRTRQIFDCEGCLVPLDLLYSPGDWDRPIHIRFPLVFAEEK
jgi:hypothetical protein